MQISTFWQPSYKPPGYQKMVPIVIEHGGVMKNTRERVYQYLEANGMRSKIEITADLQITASQLRHAVHELSGLVDYEQTGAGSSRTTNYWTLNNPPQTSQRSAIHRAYVWFQGQDWCHANEIPNHICKTSQKTSIAWMLESTGKLISRADGWKKQYRAAA